MQLTENGGDVVSRAGVGEHSCSRVLDVLEFIEEFGW